MWKQANAYQPQAGWLAHGAWSAAAESGVRELRPHAQLASDSLAVPCSVCQADPMLRRPSDEVLANGRVRKPHAPVPSPCGRYLIPCAASSSCSQRVESHCLEHLPAERGVGGTLPQTAVAGMPAVARVATAHRAPGPSEPECEDLPASDCATGHCPAASDGRPQSCRPSGGGCACAPTDADPDPDVWAPAAGNESPAGGCRLDVLPYSCRDASCGCGGGSAEACGIRISPWNRDFDLPQPHGRDRLRALPGYGDPQFGDDVVHFGFSGWTDSGKATVYSWRVNPPDPQDVILLAGEVPCGKDQRPRKVCAPVFRVTDDPVTGSMSRVPRVRRPPAGPKYGSGINRRYPGGPYFVRQPFSMAERYGVAAAGMDRRAGWVCIATTEVPIWDVDMMIECYDDVIVEVRHRAKAAGLARRSMFELWASMGLLGVRALGALYWQRAASCRGPIKNVSVCAGISACIAEDMWLALVKLDAPNPTWQGILDAGDMEIPPISMWAVTREVWARGQGPWDAFMRQSRSFGSAHVRRGIAKALRAMNLDDDARNCLIDDIVVIARELADVQRVTFVQFFDWPAALGWSELGEVSRLIFEPILRQNLLWALRDAGLSREADAVARRWE
jgi:hypothetical protein